VAQIEEVRAKAVMKPIAASTPAMGVPVEQSDEWFADAMNK